MKTIFITFTALTVAVTTVPAQSLIGSWPEDGGNITVTAVGGPIEARGLELTSSNDGLIPILSGSGAPFHFLLSNNSSQVTFGNLGRPLIIEGSLELPVGAAADAVVSGHWGNGTTPVPFPLEGGGGNNGGGNNGGGNNGGGDNGGGDNGGGNNGGVKPFKPCPDTPVCARFPANGGPITLTSNSPIYASGLDFQSPNNGLIPAPGGKTAEGAAPFIFLLANNSGQVTYANLVTPLEIHGDLRLSVGAKSGAEVTGHWGNHRRPAEFPVVRDESDTSGGGQTGGGEGGGSETGGGTTPCADGQPICGTFPGGGTITIWTDSPYNASGLDFISSNEGLIPVPPGDLTASPAPFNFLLANSSAQVTYGNLGSFVTIDGKLELSVGAIDGAAVSAMWGDVGHYTFEVTQVDDGGEGGGGQGGGGGQSSGEETACKATPICASFPPEGGAITITTNEPIDMVSLDFVSTNNGLIPILPGDMTASPAPFTFLLANSSAQVTYGNLGSAVTVDGELKLSVGAIAGAEITATWGNGTTPSSFPVEAANPIVPEPTAGLMAALAAAGILGLRSRRR